MVSSPNAAAAAPARARAAPAGHASATANTARARNAKRSSKRTRGASASSNSAASRRKQRSKGSGKSPSSAGRLRGASKSSPSPAGTSRSPIHSSEQRPPRLVITISCLTSLPPARARRTLWSASCDSICTCVGGDASGPTKFSARSKSQWAASGPATSSARKRHICSRRCAAASPSGPGAPLSAHADGQERTTSSDFNMLRAMRHKRRASSSMRPNCAGECSMPDEVGVASLMIASSSHSPTT
mmetsp:Transcript_90630/g.261137  ORF Transcript_90630/g.261137 Transcript_90630/m.261137 type:complete len:244 (+) Transcript_90630:620-1351(+)